MTTIKESNNVDAQSSSDVIYNLHKFYSRLCLLPLKEVRGMSIEAGITSGSRATWGNLIKSLLVHECEKPENATSPLMYGSERIYFEGKVRIVFLDVDGVLNNTKTRQRNPRLERSCMEHLIKLVNETDARIVLSSSWRNTLSHKLNLIHSLLQTGMDSPSRFVGETPSISFYARSREISMWLALVDRQRQGKENKNDENESKENDVEDNNEIEIESFVILDDIDFFAKDEELKKRFVWVDRKVGLSKETVMQAKRILAISKSI